MEEGHRCGPMPHWEPKGLRERERESQRENFTNPRTEMKGFQAVHESPYLPCY